MTEYRITSTSFIKDDNIFNEFEKNICNKKEIGKQGSKVVYTGAETEHQIAALVALQLTEEAV